MNVTTINPVDGTEMTLTGKVRGYWIVHKDSKRRGTYTVTHIPSGFFALAYVKLQRDAIAVAELFASLTIDASAYPMPPGHMEQVVKALANWRNERGEYRG
jgi:hypothetical protein